MLSLSNLFQAKMESRILLTPFLFADEEFMKSASKVYKNLVCCFSFIVLILLIPINVSGNESIRALPLDNTSKLVIHIQDVTGHELYSAVTAYKAGTREVVRTVNSSQDLDWDYISEWCEARP